MDSAKVRTFRHLRKQECWTTCNVLDIMVLSKTMTLTSEQRDNLKRIIARQYGGIGCNVPVSSCVFLVNAGLAEIRATNAGIDLIANGESISPGLIASWIRGFKMAHGRDNGRETDLLATLGGIKPKKKRSMSYAQAVRQAKEEARLKREHEEWVKTETERLEAINAKNNP